MDKKIAKKHGDNKQFIMILSEQSFILRVKTIAQKS